ncbi:hypothetical protein [Hoylesella timonensis]|uniref:hypothetical protein n=1 Tax=Hoylesella timonensis TaxID=386414 RepID=UPI00189B06F9|nr:hypothetical protein [Hoylesella timonensis]
MTNNDIPICMAEEYWANSYFSIVRHYGRITIGRDEYIVVNKDGLDVFALSTIAERTGKEKAIEPGEPCDLVRVDFIKYYKELKRDKFIAILKRHPHASAKELKTIMKEKIKNKQQ